MKKVGFVMPSSGHMSRGIGFYTKNILPQLQKLAPKFDISILEINNSLDIGHLQLDILHYPYFDLFTNSLKNYPNIKTVVNIYDTIPLLYPDRYKTGLKAKLNFLLQKHALAKVSAIITDSYSVIGDLVQHLAIPHPKIKLVYLAGAPHFKKSPRKIDLPEKFILYVGDINYSKNLPLLIKVAHDSKLNLIIVGKSAAGIISMDLDHPELIHLKEVVPILKSSPYITCLGFVSDTDLVSVYNQATVYCQPSLSEGFGLSVLEAMACGTPVIISNAPALTEISGNAALQFSSENELRDQLALVFKDSALRTKLSKQGIIQSQKFSWHKAAQETLMIYQSVL